MAGVHLQSGQIGEEPLCDLIILLPQIAVFGQLALVVQEVLQRLLCLLSTLCRLFDVFHCPLLRLMSR